MGFKTREILFSSLKNSAAPPDDGVPRLTVLNLLGIIYQKVTQCKVGWKYLKNRTLSEGVGSALKCVPKVRLIRKVLIVRIQSEGVSLVSNNVL